MLLIRLFGKTEVVDDKGTTVTDFGGGKPRQILAILALAAGTPVRKHRLADLLWDGAPPKSYVATLESYVCVLRRKLGLLGGRTCAIRTTPQGYVLDLSEVRVDLLEARALIHRVEGASTPAGSLDLADQAVRSLRGELLAGEDAYWATEERELLGREVVGMCTRAAADALSLEDFDSAVRMAHLATTYDRFAEVAWQHLMRALWSDGRRCEALRCYFALRTTMLDELAVEPSPPTRALYLQILCDEPAPEMRTETPDGEIKGLLTLLGQVLDTIRGAQIPEDDGPLVDEALSLVRVRVA